MSYYGTCGPTAEQGGAFWPSQSADDTCGVQFWSNQVQIKNFVLKYDIYYIMKDIIT